jgi:hypothetical protein
MVLFGMLRIIMKKEYRDFVWNSLDKALIFWTLSSMFFFTIRQFGTSPLINRLGYGFDAFGMYFLFRCLIRSWSDLDKAIFGIILISIPIAIFFIIEYRTGRNIFSVFGGVSEITQIRQGKLRCQGAYSHPILAGCFWASLIPLMSAYWFKANRYKHWAVIGVMCALIVIFCCASSTPVMGVISAAVGGLMFYYRRNMRAIRWGIAITLVLLHIVMEAPVWHLISRISAVGGSTGWHRFNLIDKAIRNFGDWYASGCSVYTVASWGIWAGDVTNQYIAEGVTGGFITLSLFIAVIAIAFREIGKRWRLYPNNRYRLALSWVVGVCLFVHTMNFIGVTYFGQINILWYLVLAVIGSLSLNTKRSLRKNG